MVADRLRKALGLKTVEEKFEEALQETQRQVEALETALREAELILARALGETTDDREDSFYGADRWERARLRARTKKNELANLRAEKLLRDHLTEGQVAEWNRNRRIAVKGKTMLYTIKENGQVFANRKFLCTYPTVAIPPADQVLATKLLIEGNEEEFLENANPDSSYSKRLTVDGELVRREYKFRDSTLLFNPNGYFTPDMYRQYANDLRQIYGVGTATTNTTINTTTTTTPGTGTLFATNAQMTGLRPYLAPTVRTNATTTEIEFTARYEET